MYINTLKINVAVVNEKSVVKHMQRFFLKKEITFLEKISYELKISLEAETKTDSSP
jgi:hypothetical protein